ncbi:COG4-domain-containing protein [Rickenella mellea]|uniref:Conserved oligomeric Golgi complex subunit 4 n=1 Tax=Rickenella mellea TaxID=50990 RepID=A0A4Y7QCU9_9AGAM|nr:COG4-domain-containing protein [Rickenella mellea]
MFDVQNKCVPIGSKSFMAATVTESQNNLNNSRRHSPRSLTTLPEILSSLSSLQTEETALSASLAHLLASQEPILASLARLQNLAPQLDELHLDASILSQNVSTTAQTADRIGGRVKQLDEEMSRVREAGERVAQVMELKSSIAALQSSIESQDWESATRHCARAMDLPLELISGPFAESAVPTSESPLPPLQTLQAARERLLDVFIRHFRQASRARDAAATSRFFKLFPPIGWEKEGLDAYAEFVLDLVQTNAPPSAKMSSPLYFITALTALFESVCHIIDQHQPIVEKYYGSGKMLYVVSKLMKECDLAVKKLVDGWEAERSMNRKLDETQRTSAPLVAQPIRKNALLSNAEDEDTADPRDVDKALTETSAMIMRFTAFRRFIYATLHDHSSESDEKSTNGVQFQGSRRPSLNSTHLLENQTREPELLDVEPVDSSDSRHLFDEVSTKYYIPLEVWYLSTTTKQAHRTSTVDTTQSPPITTVPDLVFYVLKAVLFRILNTGSISVINGVLGRIRDVMERDYVGVIKRRLDDVYRNAGGSGTGSREKSDRENRLNFIVHLNDLDISSSHMERLVKDILSSHALQQNFLEQEITSVKAAFSSLLTLVNKFHSSLKAGIEQLFNQLMRPRLRTLISDVYKDVSYVLDEDAYASSEYQDVVRKRFVRTWESSFDGFKDTLTESNYRILFGLAVDILVRPWEKFVMGLKFSELGAIRFDRDIRAISSHLSSQTTFGDAREKFQCLQQISTLLNLDREEDVDEFFSGSGISWKLSIADARSIVALKV